MAGWRRARAKAKARDNAAPAAPPTPVAPLPVEALVVTGDPQPAETVPTSAPTPAVDSQVELLRLFEVVTTMCDHVIGYIEADRAERQLMMQTLEQLGRIIADGAAAAMAATAAQQVSGPSAPLEIAAEDDHSRTDSSPASRTEPFAFTRRERVIGGSMPAGPEPIIDLVGAESAAGPEREIDLRAPEPASDAAARAAHPASGPPSTESVEIAVEVRGRFGDRWVDGFEICEVMTTPSGPRYRLRRQRDGVVLPELFDATNIRHVETFDQLGGTGFDGAPSNGHPNNGASVTGINGATGYWSRS